MTELAQVIPFPVHRMRRDTERWVDKKELADHLGVSETWIERRYKMGLPHFKDPGSRLVRFRISEVEEWMGTRRGRSA